MLYVCKRCDYQTDNKSHYLKHLDRKTICPPIKADVSLDELYKVVEAQSHKSFYCPSCNKAYSSRSAVMYHQQHKCISLIEKIRLLEQKLELAESRTAAPTTIQNVHGNNNIIQQQNNIHIHLRPFGDEIKNHISREFALECFSKGAMGIIDMLDKIYFDEGTPVNHNVKLRSLKNYLVEVFRDPNWETRGFHDTVDQMISHSRTEIIKDVSPSDIAQQHDKLLTMNNIINMPKDKVKKAKEFVRARLVARKEATQKNDAII